MTLPNKLTIARICLIPVLVIVLQMGMSQGFAIEMQTARQIAVAIFIIASITDWLDGFIARRYNLSTDFGKFMDPLADKVLVMAAMVYLVVMGDIAPWVLIITQAREFIIAGMRMVAANKGIVIAAGLMGKLKTIAQMVMIPIVMLDLESPIFGVIGYVLVLLSVVLAVASALQYIWVNRAVFK